MNIKIVARNKTSGSKKELTFAKNFEGLWLFFYNCPPYKLYNEKLLTIDAWENFIATIEPQWYMLRSALTAYSLYYHERVELNQEQINQIREYEDWYKKIFEYYSIRGYGYDAHILINWYSARDIVRKFLQDDDYDVIVVHSN